MPRTTLSLLIVAIIVLFANGQVHYELKEPQILDQDVQYSLGNLRIPLTITVGEIIPLEIEQNVTHPRICTNLREIDQKYPSNARKPNFIYVGVAKGGSTSLSEYLPVHPEIGGVLIKEPNFFSFPFVFKIDPQSYSSIFEPVPNGVDKWFTGEYSTGYIFHPMTPKHIATELPDVKIIMFLRNPVDRAYSHFVMQRRSGIEGLPFEMIVERELEDLPKILSVFRECFNLDSCEMQDCLDGSIRVNSHSFTNIRKLPLDDPMSVKRFMFTSYIARGIYYDQVQRYLSSFPRENILIVPSEDFYDNSEAVLQRILKFIGASPFSFADTGILDSTWGGGASNSHSPHDYQPIHPDTRKILNDFFKPYNELLFDLIGERFSWDINE